MTFLSKSTTALLLACAAGGASAQPHNQLTRVPVPVAEVSLPLSEMAQQAAAQPVEPRAPRLIPYRRVTAQMRTPVRPSVLQNRAADPYSTLISWPAKPALPHVYTNGTPVNIEGVPQNSGAPSDANGAVGFSQYVQWVNTQFAIYSKTDGALLLGPVDGNVLWSGLTGTPGFDTCRTANQGDPIVQYDQLAKRWVLTQLAFTSLNGPFFQCIAISTSDDATGSYYRYVLGVNDNGVSLLGDYPKMSVWPDAYYFSFVLFTNANGGYRGPGVCGLDRVPMLSGGATSAACYNFGPAFGPILTSDIDGQIPPAADSPVYLMALDFGEDGSGDHLFFWRFSFSGLYVTDALTVPVAPFIIGCPTTGTCIKQPPPGEPLDALSDRLMYRLAYRNFGNREALVVNHSVQQPGAPTNGPVGVRWYELRDPATSPYVYQQGTIAPDGDSRWMASMGIDKSGNIAVGYSVSGPATYPGIRYTGRLRTEPMGRMEVEGVIVNGSGAQVNTFGRWGDYSGMETDPFDECTFWYTNQYIASTGAFTWRSRIANFKFRNCNLTGTPGAPPGP